MVMVDSVRHIHTYSSSVAHRIMLSALLLALLAAASTANLTDDEVLICSTKPGRTFSYGKKDSPTLEEYPEPYLPDEVRYPAGKKIRHPPRGGKDVMYIYPGGGQFERPPYERPYKYRPPPLPPPEYLAEMGNHEPNKPGHGEYLAEMIYNHGRSSKKSKSKPLKLPPQYDPSFEPKFIPFDPKAKPIPYEPEIKFNKKYEDYEGKRKPEYDPYDCKKPDHYEPYEAKTDPKYDFLDTKNSKFEPLDMKSDLRFISKYTSSNEGYERPLRSKPKAERYDFKYNSNDSKFEPKCKHCEECSACEDEEAYNSKSKGDGKSKCEDCEECAECDLAAEPEEPKYERIPYEPKYKVPDENPKEKEPTFRRRPVKEKCKEKFPSHGYYTEESKETRLTSGKHVAVPCENNSEFESCDCS